MGTGRARRRADATTDLSLCSGVKCCHAGRQGVAAREASGFQSLSSAFLKWEKMIQEFPPRSPRQAGPICRCHRGVIMALSAVPGSRSCYRVNSLQTCLPSASTPGAVVFKKSEISWALKVSHPKSPLAAFALERHLARRRFHRIEKNVHERGPARPRPCQSK